MDKPLPTHISEFADEARFQQHIQDMIRQGKQLGADQIEVGINASIGLQVTVRKSEVETIEFNRDKSCGITVYMKNRKGSASTTDLNAQSLQEAVKAAVNLAKLTEPDPFAGLAEVFDMAQSYPYLDLYHPWDLTIGEATRLTKTCEESGYAEDKKIINSEGASCQSTQGIHVYGNSHGFIGSYPTSRHSLSCVLIAQDSQGMERDHQYTIARNPQQMSKAQQVGVEAAKRAVERLGGRKIHTQRAPVLFHASIAAGLLSQFIAAISGGRLFRQSSFLLDSLGKQIFQPNIHIYERPHLPGEMGSAPFDGDGVLTKDKDIVVDGMVKNYILSAYSARKLKLANTGNSGGIHNLFIQPATDDFQAMLKKLNKGLLVMELMGPGINLVTGDYSRGAAGFWVEHGEIQYPVSEITIAGNMRDMFRQLLVVGNDIDNRNVIQSGSLLIEEMMIAGT